MERNTRSSVIDEVIRRRRLYSQAKKSLYTGFAEMLIAFILVIDVYRGFASNFYLSINFASIFWTAGEELLASLNLFLILIIVELVLSLFLSFKALRDFMFYFWPFFGLKQLEISPEEKRLLRIRDDEYGFLVRPREDQNVDRKGPIHSKTPPFVINTSDLITSTPYAQNKSALSQSLDCSSPSSGVNAADVSYPLQNSSWLHKRNVSNLSQTANSSFLSTSLSWNASQRSGTRDNISDEPSLENYLKQFQEVEMKLHEMSKIEQQQIHSQGYLSLSDQSIHSLPTETYQPANDTSVSNANVEEISNLSSNLKIVDEVVSVLQASIKKCLFQFLDRVNASETQLYQWIENIRSWISQTILSRVVLEINKVNETLSKQGLADSLIGEAGLSSLKQLSSLKGRECPSLPALLPYLEISLCQEYLVQRLRDLAKGGCMADFNWNRGAIYKGKEWHEEYPSDAQIIMHMFCTYMDSRLPPQPNCTDGKPFTSMYFKTSYEPQRKNVYILQSRLNPPNYNVVIPTEGIYEVPAGRNNIFYALILFLQVIKLKNFGLLGRVNLGASGVNILWTIEK